ncbi:MAG: hypothetical protein M3Q14_01750, partial [bacterium]|nr:hypothetical protein [bacterium]
VIFGEDEERLWRLFRGAVRNTTIALFEYPRRHSLESGGVIVRGRLTVIGVHQAAQLQEHYLRSFKNTKNIRVNSKYL